jgi:AcrR family transcriptional regulator
VRRIHEATRRCVDRSGARTTMSEVARELGVTRQTVYRYFPSIEALLSATALAGADRFLEELHSHLAPLGDDPATVAVEAVAYALERLPHEPYLGLLLHPDQIGVFGAGITSEPSRLLARSVVDQLPVDWSARGVDDRTLSELAEHLLRIIQSFVVDPGDPPRRGAELRGYLDRWIAPAVRACAVPT